MPAGAGSPVPGSARADGPTVPAGHAPARPFAVGVRTLQLSHGADRPLPTTVWYPAAGSPGGAARSGAAPAPGRFPLIVFSHGLNGTPQLYAPVTTRWAAAGFVIAAPRYPHTYLGAAAFDITDIANQPADASLVITEILRLAAGPGDALAGHVDPDRVAAAGHSAGGFTTVGMLTGHRDTRLRAAVVIAGGAMGGAFSGPPAPVLFVHGDQDTTVSYRTARAVYDRLSWPRAFLTLIGQGHSDYLASGDADGNPAMRTSIDFLRWSLYGDTAAHARLGADGTAAGQAAIDLRL